MKIVPMEFSHAETGSFTPFPTWEASSVQLADVKFYFCTYQGQVYTLLDARSSTHKSALVRGYGKDESMTIFEHLTEDQVRQAFEDLPSLLPAQEES